LIGRLGFARIAKLHNDLPLSRRVFQRSAPAACWAASSLPVKLTEHARNTLGANESPFVGTECADRLNAEFLFSLRYFLVSKNEAPARSERVANISTHFRKSFRISDLEQ